MSPIFLNSPKEENKNRVASPSSLSIENNGKTIENVNAKKNFKDNKETNDIVPVQKINLSRSISNISDSRGSWKRDAFKSASPGRFLDLNQASSLSTSMSSLTTSSKPQTPESDSSSFLSPVQDRFSGSVERVNHESPRAHGAPQPNISVGKLVSPRISQLRQQFLQNDQQAAKEQHQRLRPIGEPKNATGEGGGIRRSHSLPPREVKPTVIKVRVT